MEIEKLKIKQYLNIHLVKNKKFKLKTEYIYQIKEIGNVLGLNDTWSNECIKLFIIKFFENEIKEKKISLNKQFINSIYKKYNERIVINHLIKLKYLIKRDELYNLFLDCLFIYAFNDKKIGKEILYYFQSKFKIYKRKFDEIFEIFYAEKNLKKMKYSLKIKKICGSILKNREFINEKEKRILICANMSAGKSTLLNALCGKKINKTQNDACTAKAHYILNKSGEDGYTYELDNDLCLNATKKILMEDNELNSENKIYVSTRFRSLYKIKKSICFIDTPGVNSSLNEEHKKITEKIISDEKFDLLIYIFNGENIGTNDDIKYLKYLYENVKTDIIFLVNKLDKFKTNVDSVKETINKAKKDLEKIGYKKIKIYPISAYAAYLAKMKLFNEQLNIDEDDEFYFFSKKLNREGFRYDKYYKNKISVKDENKDYEILLRNSGVLNLESILYR